MVEGIQYDSSTEFDEVFNRLKLAVGVKSDSKFGTFLGIRQSSISGAKNRGQLPPNWIVEVASRTGVSADWLLFGVGAMRRVGEPSETVAPGVTKFSQTDAIPIVGLANCGINGWQSQTPIAMSATAPTISKHAIAIIAFGKSMLPAGIAEGRLLYCDPELEPIKGEAVYVVRKDNTASLKLFLGMDEQWIKLQGWLEPNNEGLQKPYISKERASDISLIAPVVYARHRL